ncbi:acyl-ACP--UDP-N-acetylglucosamine O-acyltransferase [Candidatus Margulisiibacteriota bacterium]
MSNKQLDSLAHIHSSAQLGEGVKVGPYAIIDENAVIGDNSIIDAHAVIGAGSKIGKECHIHYGAIIGDMPQDVKYAGEKTNVVMGDRNQIREYVTINRATGPGNKTILGDNNILMSHVHIGHNTKLGSNVVIVSLSQLAGHVTIEDSVIIGGMVGIPQFLRVGKMTMIGGYARLFQDIPPYMLVEGNPADVQAINSVGLKRNNMKREIISIIKESYKLLYRSGLNTSQALESIYEKCRINGRVPEEIQYLIDFIKKSTKGINRKKTSTELLSSEGSGLAETEGFFAKVKHILTK